LRIVAKALQSEVRAFSEARSVLLDLLLSGRHRIPDSYDTLLELQGW
jgi:hypothetical protein